MNFYSAHVNIQCTYQDEDYYIFGLNKERGDLDSFGGHRDGNETIIETILRECFEESLNAIPTDKLKESLNDAECYYIESDKGRHYNLFIHIGEVDFYEMQEIFHNNFSPDLPLPYQENIALICIPINKLDDYFKYLRKESQPFWIYYLWDIQLKNLCSYL